MDIFYFVFKLLSHMYVESALKNDSDPSLLLLHSSLDAFALLVVFYFGQASAPLWNEIKFFLFCS